MKKALLVLAMAMLTLTAAANPVDRATAQRVATTMMSLNGGSTELTDVTRQTTFTGFYIFTAGQGGFVIVSADDCVTPVLGFSTTATFDAKRIPANVYEVLEGYEQEIRYWTSQDGLMANGDWQNLLTGTAPEPVDPTAVAPLLSTTWDQDPYYNNLCPYDNTFSERTVTGCVATATAQIMKKWNHPTTGYGSHSYTASNSYSNYGTLSANFGTTTYQWSTMPNALTSTSSTAQVNAVATLMYHIGIADEMNYDISAHGGSGASNYNYYGYVDVSSETSLQLYFKYRSDMAAIAREDYSNAQYIALLKADLDAGRPILFSGRDTTAGHSFVCDGYNNSDMFHINWGWGGYYNGYFAMGALNPDGGGTGSNTGTYNISNVALTRIQPNTSWSSTGTTTVTATATGGTGCSVSGAGSYSFGDTVHLQAVAATGYHFTGWSDGCKFNPRQFIANGGTLTFTAQFEALGGDTITYCPGNRYLTSLGAYGTSYWGIRIPSSALDTNVLNQVQFYASETGSHTLTVYSGTSSPTTTLYTTTFNVTSTGWNTINTGSVTPTTGQDLWITFSSATDYPAAMSYSGGHNYGLLWGSSFTYAGYSQCSWMIRGIFGTGGTPTPPATSDTCLITTFPYTENFDNSSTYSCLRIIDANNDSIYWGLTLNYGYDSSICAYIRYADSADDYLILPGIATAGNYSVSWKVKAMSSNYPETYQVWASDSMIYSETLTSTSYVTRTASFSVAAGDTLNLMFRYISNDMYYLFLDDITISVYTPPVQYTITVQSADPTMGSVSGGGTYNAGSTATISATANSGYHFTQWQDGNTQATRNITVSGNATYTASFAANSGSATTDTISWCDTASFATSIGAGGSLYWGISLTPTQLSGHTYLKSVMLYVAYAGTYTLNIYTGGTTAPGTAAHTQTVVFGASELGWQEILLDATFTINQTQNLWITFYNNDVTYPATACAYVNNTNSDWTSVDGTSWDHLQSLSSTLTYSWLIKAVTTNTAPSLPAPTVHIAGSAYATTGTAQTFTATATTGAAVSWTLTGATPSIATGTTATATWSTPGTYNVIATATNSYGTGRDTLVVSVISCGTVTTFPYTLGFNDDDIVKTSCWTMVDADGDGYGWTTDFIDGYVASASYINSVGALTPDNWMISPQMQFTAGSTYALNWTVGAVDTNYYAEHYGVYISTTGTDTSDFTLLQQYTLTTATLTDMTLDLSSYAGQNVYIAFRHWSVSDEYWMVIDSISVTQTAIPGQNYTITVQSADPTMGSVSGGGTFAAGTTTTISATANSGYHFTQWQDGNTQATRTITVNGDATYTASFAADAPTQYTITVLSNNDTWGNVTGGGTYAAGSSVTLNAMPYSGYQFVQWQDGVTTAQRTITVTADATYIATFAESTGIDDAEGSASWTLYPNPASSSVSIVGVEQGTVTVCDITGRTVDTHRIEGGNHTIDISNLAAGTYFIRITSGNSNAVRKLIVK